MVHKRHFDDEKASDVSSKHPRQVDKPNQLVSFAETIFPQNTSLIPHSLGEDESVDILDNEKHASGIVIQHPQSTKDNETNHPEGISITSWSTSSTKEDDTGLQPPFHISLFSEYFNPEHPIRTLAHCEDIYCLLLECPPRKSIPVGENHQVDVPAWGSHETKNCSNHLSSSEAVLGTEHVDMEEHEKVLMGTCVIPLPDLGLSAYDFDEVGKGRSDCSCEDEGSVRCVRQHIMEARKELKKSIGKERFMELGFYEMGEFVAEQWSEEEEKLFHKIVFSNPVSMGKNFWDTLAVVFPSQTKKEIVSYYFNVFMLRRRTEQNRCDIMNVNSDDDEWHETDDSADCEAGMSDEDEDPVIESCRFEDGLGYHQNMENDLRVDVTDEACPNEGNRYFSSGRGIRNISETYSGKVLPHLQDKILMGERGDHVARNDSFTSSDGGAPSEGTQLGTDNGQSWWDCFNEPNGSGGGHQHHLGPSDAKSWDAGYITCHKNKVDFLSTHSMIEEVFGDEP